VKLQLTQHIILRASLIVKAFDAGLEIIGGILLLMPLKLDSWIEALCRHELAIGKHEAAALRLQELAANSLSAVTIGAAIYLIAHGAVKLLFITAVMKEKPWGYVGLMSFMSLFTALELYRFVAHGSYLVLAFAAFDGLIVYLASREFFESPKSGRRLRPRFDDPS